MSVVGCAAFRLLLLLSAIIVLSAFIVPSIYAQSSTITVEYTINANNRDAWSGDAHTGNTQHEVRINGYNSTNEPYEFVGNDSDAESAAMEFQVSIPRGATIQNAFLAVKAGSFQNTSPTGAMDIHLYDVANAQPFANGFFGDLVNHHPTYSQTIPWNANSSWSNGSSQQTPNIASFVQIFVNRGDYVPGNYIGFAITGGTIQVGKYYGWEDYFANGTPAKLSITYAGGVPSSTNTPTPAVTPSASPSVMPTATRPATSTPTSQPIMTPTPTRTPTSTPSFGSQQIAIPVALSSNDVNQDGSTNLLTSGSPMWVGTGQSTSASYTGLRFTGVTIPRNTTITEAYLRFYSTQAQWVTIDMQFSGDNVGNSAVFDSTHMPSQRSLTTQRVSHSSNVQWLANQWYQSNNIAPIVQAIISRADWQSGNSLSIIIQGTGSQYGRKVVQSYDGNTSLAPQLVIKYQ